MKRMRSHPVNILENTSRYLILLLLPLIRALWNLLTTGGSLYSWVKGAWFDLVVLGVMLGLGIYKWYIYVFSFNEDGIYLRQGIFFRKHRFIPFPKVTAISIVEPWYYRPLHAVHLKADTDGGRAKTPDFSITVGKQHAQHLLLLSKHPFIEPTQLKRFYIPSNVYVAIFSLLTSNSLTGVIYVAASVSQIGNIFGHDIEDKLFSGFTRLIKMVAFGLPPIAAAVGYAILGCWLLAFTVSLFRHLRFSSSRHGDCLEVHSGLFSPRSHSIAVLRINFLMIRQSLLTKLFHLSSVFIYCTGYGKDKDELSVLMPASLSKELKANLQILLPEISFAPRQIKPKLINLSRFLIPPGSLLLGVLAAGLLAIYFLPSFRTTFIALTIIFEIPCVWWLAVKFYSFFFNGIGANQDAVTLYYTSGYKVITCSIPRQKISKIQLTQTLFQIATKCCDVTFYVYGEGTKRQKVVNLKLPEVRELLQHTDADLGMQPISHFTLWR